MCLIPTIQPTDHRRVPMKPSCQLLVREPTPLPRTIGEHVVDFFPPQADVLGEPLHEILAVGPRRAQTELPPGLPVRPLPGVLDLLDAQFHATAEPADRIQRAQFAHLVAQQIESFIAVAGSAVPRSNRSMSPVDAPVQTVKVAPAALRTGGMSARAETGSVEAAITATSLPA